MSRLEKLIFLFAKKNDFNITPTEWGFRAVKGRVVLDYVTENNKDFFYGSKLLSPDKPIDESSISVEAPDSSQKRELFAHIRFGCLRDYLSQLQGAEWPVMRELRARLEYELQLEEKPTYTIEEKFTDFNLFDVYHLLERFYP